MTKNTALLIAVLLLSGYVPESIARGPGNVRDISTGGETAQIITPNAHGCTIRLPVKANVLTLDAGTVFLVQTCSKPASLLNELTGGDLGFGRKRQTFTRTFHFGAKPGKTYELEGECLHSPGETPICAPLLPGLAYGREPSMLKDNCGEEYAVRKQMDSSVRTRADSSKKVPFSKFWKKYCVADLQISIGTPVARIIPGGAISDRSACWPSAAAIQPRKRNALLSVSAGQTQIDATCMQPVSDSQVSEKTTSFHFNAEPGHVYTLSGEDEVCMSLIDITSEDKVIACEAYHQDPE